MKEIFCIVCVVMLAFVVVNVGEIFANADAAVRSAKLERQAQEHEAKYGFRPNL